MSLIKTSIGLKAIPVTISLKYTIEDSIYDVDMLICIFVKNAIQQNIPLKQIIKEFTKGEFNDQYIMFEKTFVEIFKDDGVKSFDDFAIAGPRAEKIIKQSSMVYDAYTKVESFWLSEIKRFQINLNGKLRYISKEKIESFFSENFRDFIEKSSHLNKKPTYIKADKFTPTEDEYEKDIKIEVDNEFEQIVIDNQIFIEPSILNKAITEFKIKTFEISKSIRGFNSKSLKPIEKINSEFEMLLRNISNKNTISSFNDWLNTNEENSIIEYSNERLIKYNLNLYKGIIVYSTNEISFRELIDMSNWNVEFNVNNEILKCLISEISNNNDFKLVETYVKNNSLNQKIIEILLKEKIDLLINSDVSILDEITYSSLITNNKISEGISYLNRFLLINKHSKSILDDNDETTNRFLFNVYTQDNGLLDSKQIENVKEYMKLKDALKTKMRELQTEANEIRTDINKLEEEHGDIVSDKQLVIELKSIRQYLNRVVHISEEDKSNGKMPNANPELKKWIAAYSNDYDYDFISEELVNAISERFKDFKDFKERYSIHINERIIEIENEESENNEEN